ncbi:dermonecrotic toxin domain-containing protein [Pseudomonas alkylphenolica]|uniref:dermonecrotic toxin domain-containing protein n=1 Tax=Pseudomonas alkylphenolica TaxID=237609 RepID=UPI00315CE0E5
MLTSQSISVPGLHGRFLVDRLPDWLKHATVADLKRWRESQRPAQLNPSGSSAWFFDASEEARQALLDAQQSSRRSVRALATALKDFQGLGAFAEPLLKAKLKADLNVELDVNTTELVEIHQESVLLGSMLRIRPRQQSLLQAAMQNFAADSEFLPGSALAAKGDFLLELAPGQEGAYPRFQYRYTRQLDIEPARFAALCHELDLGGKYQTHLSEVFESPSTRDAVRTLSINAYKDNLRLVAQTALMKGEISAPVQQMFNDLLKGERAPLLHGKPVICQSLSMFQSALDGVLVFSANRVVSDEVEPIVVYLPGAPLYPLKEYASVAAFKQDLRINLLTSTYLELLRTFVPRHEQEHFFKRLDEALYDRSLDAGGQLKPEANLHLRDVAIESELFGYVQDQQLQRIKANARDLAVPSAQADEAAKKQRLAYWESIGFNALNAAAFFVPVLDAVMAAVAAGQLVKEIVDGAHAWEAGELDEALAHFESVALNVVLAVGLGAAGHVAAPLQASERVDSLVRVTLPNGEQRLWKPDLTPYARNVELTDIAPNGMGVYRLDGKSYIRIDGQVFEVFEDAEGAWSIRHPDAPDAYQPALKHNQEGTWQAVGEQPMQWSHEKLLSRIGVTAEGLPAEVLEQAVRISGIDDDVLRRMHLDQLAVPPLLKETLQRFQIDRRVTRLINSLKEGAPGVPGLGLEPSLSQELPRWPQRVIEVYDEIMPDRAPVRYGAKRWPSGRVIRISEKELHANKLAEKVLADLNETEALELFGSSVETDKRLEVLRALIADQAIKRRANIFKIMYEHQHPPRSTEQQRLLRDFPMLTDTAAKEIADAADSAERLQLQASDGRVPLRLAEEARVYQRQIVLNQAIQGVHQATLASLDSDRLALGLLVRLPGWTDTVRLEMREDSVSGRLLASVGMSGGELKTLVRKGGRYTAYDAQALELSKDQEIIVSLLKALPDSERRALNLDIHAVQSLRSVLYSLAVEDRARAAQLLGQQPIRPWFRTPLRLADGRVGYPLGGSISTMVVNARLNALFPELSEAGLEAMKVRLLRGNQTLADGVFRLEAEYATLRQTLEQWEGTSQNIFERRSREIVREKLINAWRQIGGRSRVTLTLDERDVGSLPSLTARFDQVRILNMNDMNLEQVPAGWLRCFPNLYTLSLQGNRLGAIPPDIMALTGLHELDLTGISLGSSDSMFDALQPLTRLRSLELQSNQLNSIPSAALETLSRLTVLTRLNLRYNPVGLSTNDLEILARLPLQELDLSSTGLALDEAGAQVFSRLERLQRLRLSGNTLGRAPELSNLTQLRDLELNNCRLSEWPEGLTTLMDLDPYQLRIVNLSDNQIIRLPDLAATRFSAGLRADATHTTHGLNLNRNPLDAESIERLEAFMAEFEPEIPARVPGGPWLRDATQAQRDLWHDLFQHDGHKALREKLEKLALSREFQRDGADVRKRVWSMLQLASQHMQLREELLEIAAAFPVTCGDAGADAFSALEIAVLVFQRSQEAITGERSAELLALYKQLFRRHEVQRMADVLSLARKQRRQALLSDSALTPLDPLDDITDAVLASESVDDIEIRLTLRQQLKSELDYPEPSSGMLYQATANLSPQTAQRVKSAVLARDTVANRQAWMVEDINWTRYLEQRYASQFDSFREMWAEGQEYLDFCVGVFDEGPETLDSEVSTFLRTVLGADPMNAEGTLHKIEINDGQYQQASDALKSARKVAEDALMLKLTQAAEVQPEV